MITEERITNKKVKTEEPAESGVTDARVLLARYPDLKLTHEEYNINVTSNQGNEVDPQKLLAQMGLHSGADRPVHLYFHLPFCDYICKFCNYVKKKIPTGNREQTLNTWLDYLIKESELSLSQVPWSRQAIVESIYLGGGTAALFSSNQLRRILDHVHTNYRLSANCEISLEGNPDNFCGEELAQASEIGFNRFSVGIQSLQQEVLDFTGRKHTVEMSLTAIEKLKATGHPFNTDYMFGLPHQSVDSVANDIARLIDLQVPTITIYRLRNADRQAMGIGLRSSWNNKKVRDRITFPSLDETYEMRNAIVDQFIAAGYRPSPCGWWSRPEANSGEANIPQVSKNKWQNFDSMLAFGPGVYGWLTGDSADVLQTHNTLDLHAYGKKLHAGERPFSHGKQLSGYAALAVRLGFNYKSRQPIELEQYRQRFGIDLIEDSKVGPIIGRLIDRGFLAFNPYQSQLDVTLDGETLHEEIIDLCIHGEIAGLQQAVCNRRAI